MSYEGFSFFVNAMGAMLVVAGVLILIVSTRSILRDIRSEDVGTKQK